MPLSLMTVRGVGPAVLSAPSSRSMYRRLLSKGLRPAAAAAAPDELLDILRRAGQKKTNARTVASLMHAIDGFRRPRPESVMSDAELGQIRARTLFCWGRDDPYLPPGRAQLSVAKIPMPPCARFPEGTLPGSKTPPAAPG